MKKMKNYLKTGIILVGISLLMWNCQNDEFDSVSEMNNNFIPAQTVSINQAQSYFSIAQKQNTSKKGTNDFQVTPFWETANQLSLLYTDALLTNVDVSINRPGNYESKLFFIKLEDEMKNVIYTIYKDSITPKGSIINARIYLNDLNGKFIDGYRIRKGMFYSRFIPQYSDINSKPKKTAFAKEDIVWPESCAGCIALDEVFLTNTVSAGNSTTWFIGSTRGSSFSSFVDYANTSLSTTDPHPTRAAGNILINPPADDSPDQIINNLTGKEECINGLLDKTGNSYVKNILNKFDGESEFDIKIESKERVYKVNGDEVNGVAKPPINNVITIQINSFQMSSNKALQVARTILHEYIHADMFRKLNTKYPTSGDLDFRTTYESFKSDNFKASAQHESMADLYVGEMTNALKNFHKYALVSDYNYLTNNGANSLPDSFYEALAWQGLKQHDVKAYTDLSDSKKEELKNNLEFHLPTTTPNCPNN